MKIPYQNQLVEATEIETVTSHEDWNEYLMANGEVLLIKTVLVRALRANDVKAPDGTPLYSVNTQCIAKVRGTPEKV